VRIAAHDFHLTVADSDWPQWTAQGDDQFDHPYDNRLVAFLGSQGVSYTTIGGDEPVCVREVRGRRDQLQERRISSSTRSGWVRAVNP
jgi:hypothetical protein